MKRIAALFTIALLFSATSMQGQSFASDRFKVVDEYVKSLGSLDTLNMGTIAHIVTKKFPDNIDKLRAIFDWIAYNISFDVKAVRNSGNEKVNTDDVLKKRKTNASGYAALFQDMCSVMKIRCLTVDGYAKYNVEQINEVSDEFNHTWVVVQLGQSPESWYYVDPTWGSGVTDEKMTTYTRQFNDAYFFADKAIFNFQHYPDNLAWQLGPTGAKSVKDFFSMPLVKGSAYEFGVSGVQPANGFIKATTKKAVPFSFRVSAASKIEIVALQLGNDKKKRTKTVDYTVNGGTVSFSYKFDDEDSYPVTVLINNKPVIAYQAEITE